MAFNELHFAHPAWLFIGLIIPIVWVLYYLFFQKARHRLQRLEEFIDSHLLPFLLVNRQEKGRFFWKPLLLWTLVWACLTIAIAGPRWSSREIETFSADQTLVIVLDLSESMNATDIKPSRLMRAKQKIEDIINASMGVKIGMIVFAQDAHIITPITDDKETIRHLLPSLDTDLMYIQGSQLSSALDMAYPMLQAEPGANKALLVISDGGFEEKRAGASAKKLHEMGVIIHAMGVGTLEGAPLYSNRSTKKTAPPFSKLEKGKLIEMCKVGGGCYFEAEYSNDEEIVLKDLRSRADATLSRGRKDHYWDERFYIALFPILPILLWWFRRGALFALLLLFAPRLEADVTDYFKNSEQSGQEAFDQGEFEKAAELFQDPYRQGISCYKAKKYTEAETLFRKSSREEVRMSSLYNLGNALVRQQKLKNAITTYEEVLEQWPDHENAKANLELVKKMLKEQNQSDQNQKNKNENKDDSDEQAQDNENESQSEQDTQDDNESQSEPLNNNEEKSAEESPDKKEMNDEDADFWLNKIENDPKMFLKNKFTIESKKIGTKEEVDPW